MSWIHFYVFFVSFSLVMNGAKSSFKPARDLHQGDPISPYLFLLVSDVLACMLKRAQANNSIQGYKINRYCPTLTHLLFADDTVLFGKASIQERKLRALIGTTINKSGMPQNILINIHINPVSTRLQNRYIIYIKAPRTSPLDRPKGST